LLLDTELNCSDLYAEELPAELPVVRGLLRLDVSDDISLSISDPRSDEVLPVSDGISLSIPDPRRDEVLPVSDEISLSISDPRRDEVLPTEENPRSKSLLPNADGYVGVLPTER